jgi:hypothetical protein
VAAIMLLIGGEDALSGLQNVTIVAALPFLVIMVGLAVSLVKDLSRDPQVVRRQYAVAAVEHAVVAGVSEHGDDFSLAVQETAPGEGVGELVQTERAEPDDVGVEITSGGDREVLDEIDEHTERVGASMRL